jgi:hypothetical protein
MSKKIMGACGPDAQQCQKLCQSLVTLYDYFNARHTLYNNTSYEDVLNSLYFGISLVPPKPSYDYDEVHYQIFRNDDVATIEKSFKEGNLKVFHCGLCPMHDDKFSTILSYINDIDTMGYIYSHDVPYYTHILDFGSMYVTTNDIEFYLEHHLFAYTKKHLENYAFLYDSEVVNNIYVLLRNLGPNFFAVNQGVLGSIQDHCHFHLSDEKQNMISYVSVAKKLGNFYETGSEGMYVYKNMLFVQSINLSEIISVLNNIFIICYNQLYSPQNPAYLTTCLLMRGDRYVICVSFHSQVAVDTYNNLGGKEHVANYKYNPAFNKFFVYGIDAINMHNQKPSQLEPLLKNIYGNIILKNFDLMNGYVAMVARKIAFDKQYSAQNIVTNLTEIRKQSVYDILLNLNNITRWSIEQIRHFVSLDTQKLGHINVYFSKINETLRIISGAYSPEILLDLKLNEARHYMKIHKLNSFNIVLSGVYNVKLIISKILQLMDLTANRHLSNEMNERVLTGDVSKWMKNPRLIGAKSGQSIVNKFTVEGDHNANINMVVKIACGSGAKGYNSIPYEHQIGLLINQQILPYVPNFVYTIGHFICGRASADTQCVDLGPPNIQPCDNLVIESIENGILFGAYLDSVQMGPSGTLIIPPQFEENVCSVLIQIISALYVANSRVSFTHNDLHLDNIMVQHVPYNGKVQTRIFRYVLDKNHVFECDGTNRAVIIDYGAAYADGVEAEMIKLRKTRLFNQEKYRTFGSSFEKTNGVYDLFKLLCGVYNRLRNVPSTGVPTLNKIFSSLLAQFPMIFQCDNDININYARAREMERLYAGIPIHIRMLNIITEHYVAKYQRTALIYVFGLVDKPGKLPGTELISDMITQLYGRLIRTSGKLGMTTYSFHSENWVRAVGKDISDQTSDPRTLSITQPLK